MSFHLVKIHATESTNDELKLRFRESELQHLTIISTNHQTAGKGQMGTQWTAEPFKNLTFSILLTKDIDLLSNFEINQCVTLTLVGWLREKLQIQAFIKWPNDILSVHHKLAGILIENIYKNNQRTACVIGIGLNVNQLEFKNAPKAISLAQITGRNYDLDELLLDFLNYFHSHWKLWSCRLEDYEKLLYKIGTIATFKKGDQSFTAKVKGVNPQGLLLLEQEGELKTYDLKEISWVY